MIDKHWYEQARLKDDQDILASFRDEFYIKPGLLYMDGNSLGLLSKRAEKSLLRVLNEWKELGIDGWMEAATPWFFMAEELARMSAPLVGAKPEEIIVANSTSVNLHQLVATLFNPQGKKTKILTDALSFPSDIYALESQLRLRGLDPKSHLVKVNSTDGYTLNEEEIVALMTEDIQMIVLPSVIYTSGQLLDMKYLTEQAHKKDILIGFDCCHSVGAVPHSFDDWDVDFAFWCNYKYVNNGPGGTASLYLNEKHFGALPGLAGWFSSDKNHQFSMSHTATFAFGAGSLQIGTPNLLSMAPLQGSLEMFEEAGIGHIRSKSLALTAFLMDIVESELKPFGFGIANPRQEHRRGGHVSLVHPDAVRICKALKQEGIIPDYRNPNIIRLAPTALYTSFSECVETVERLRLIMDEKRYEQFETERGLVP